MNSVESSTDKAAAPADKGVVFVQAEPGQEISVFVGDLPALSEMMDRAKMAYLDMLMRSCGSHIPTVAKCLGCTDANIRKAIRHLVSKYGDDSRGEGEGGAGPAA